MVVRHNVFHNTTGYCNATGNKNGVWPADTGVNYTPPPGAPPGVGKPSGHISVGESGDQINGNASTSCYHASCNGWKNAAQCPGPNGTPPAYSQIVMLLRETLELSRLVALGRDRDLRLHVSPLAAGARPTSDRRARLESGRSDNQSGDADAKVCGWDRLSDALVLWRPGLCSDESIVGNQLE